MGLPGEALINGVWWRPTHSGRFGLWEEHLLVEVGRGPFPFVPWLLWIPLSPALPFFWPCCCSSSRGPSDETGRRVRPELVKAQPHGPSREIENVPPGLFSARRWPLEPPFTSSALRLCLLCAPPDRGCWRWLGKTDALTYTVGVPVVACGCAACREPSPSLNVGQGEVPSGPGEAERLIPLPSWWGSCHLPAEPVATGLALS